MTVCCGFQHETSFCPHCGKRLVPEHPLLSLLAHVRETAEVRDERLKKMAEDDPARNALVVVCTRWRSWQTELEKITSNLKVT